MAAIATADHPSVGPASHQLLAVRGVHKSFGRVRVLTDCEFTLRAGEVHALVGANGAGKSTLVKIISGALRADAGTVTVGDWTGSALNPRLAQRLGIATIYQEPDLVPSLTVAENLALGREPARAGMLQHRSAERTAARELCEAVGLPPARATAAVEQLSRADQQLVEIAKALHRRARIIIMDEPTAPLGPHEAQNLHGVIRRVTADGVGVIYVSHRLAEVLDVSDQVTVLRGGREIWTRDRHTVTEEAIVTAMTGQRAEEVLHPMARRPSSRVGAILRLEQVGSREQLRDINLNLHGGEVVVLAGLVGAGRSRLLHTAMGEERYDRGAMWLDDKPYRPAGPGSALRRGIALVPDDRKQRGLFSTMTITENILMTAPVRRRSVMRSKRAERSVIKGWIERMNIVPEDPDYPVALLSGGNQQKVLLARWLHRGVRVLLIDEPTQGVDPSSRRELIRLIRREAAEHQTAVLAASSEPEEIFTLADRIIVMRRGAMVAERDPADVTEEEIVALSSGARG